MEKKGSSWGLIIFCLIIVWPVGLFMVVKKLATDKSALMSRKTGVLSVVAWVLIIIAGMGFLGFMLDTSSNDSSGTTGGIILVLVMFIGGILLLRKASKTKKTATKYKKYIDMVVNQNARNLDYVASAVGLSYAVVTKDLKNMINIGYLKDAYIHEGNREIILKQFEPVPVTYAQTAVAGQTPAIPQAKAVRCSGCGANNVVTVGRVSEYEYCGTPINA